MDRFLELILAMFAFAFLIFIISRAVKTIIFLGCILIVFFVLVAFGVLG